MKNYILLFFLIVGFHLSAQNHALILNNAARINIDGGAMLIVDQSSTSGIVLNGTGTGLINSEAENNRVAWVINNGTGAYTIPFGTNAGVQIPMTYNITGAGSASGALTASTYPTSVANMPYPSVYAPAVTNTGAQWIAGAFVERSLFCADRFWVLRDLGRVWATKPTSSLLFTYTDAEIGSGNTITEANLQAQYWETNQWQPGWYDGFPLLGANNAAINNVSGINSSANGNLFTWILVDNTNPLPIELLYFAVNCSDDGVRIEWASASETNNDFYHIRRSEEGIFWETIAYISGAGNSNQPLYYSYTDFEVKDKDYIYQLIQTDFDGTQNTIGTKNIHCSAFGSNHFTSSSVNIYSDDDNNIYINYFSSQNETNIFNLFDITGKLIGSWTLNSNEGMNHFVIPVIPISSAVYLATFQQEHLITSKKIQLK